MEDNNTITLVLPQGYTRTDLFDLIAEANGYEELLRKTEKIRTVYSGEEITDEVLVMNIIEKEMTADKKIVRVVVEEIVTTETPNLVSKEEFAKKVFGKELLNFINEAKNKTKEKELQETIKRVTAEILGEDISGGEII